MDLSLGFSAVSFDSTEASVLGELEKKRICRVCDGGSFTHDLFGDWARAPHLFGEADRLDEFLAEPSHETTLV